MGGRSVTRLSSSPVQFTLRNATESERALVCDILLEAFRDIAERRFGARANVEHRRRLAEKFQRVSYRIIEVEGLAVGVVAASRHHDHVFLDDLAILPRHQSQGIGSAVLQSEVEAAHRRGKPLRLHTPRSGCAVSFYARRGFVETGRSDDFVDFEKAPTA